MHSRVFIPLTKAPRNMLTIRNAQMQTLAELRRRDTIEKYVNLPAGLEKNAFGGRFASLALAASNLDMASWRRAIVQYEQEAWEMGFREREVLETYVEARLVFGDRPWCETIERWLRPGEASEALRLARFVDATRALLSTQQEA